MIQINISESKTHTTKAFNPTDLVIRKRGLFSIKASYGSGEDRTTDEIDGVDDVNVFPAKGDQRIWCIYNQGEDGHIELYLEQYRVIGFKVVLDLLNDSTAIVPISIGLQVPGEASNAVYFLVDVDLRQITRVNCSAVDCRLWLNEDEHGPDILSAISYALNLPDLTEADLPIELVGIFEHIAEKKVVNLK